MSRGAFRCEPPLPRARLGEGPFHVRGLVYNGTIDHVERRCPGGLQAFLASIGDAELSAFISSTIFLATATYDIVPLIMLLGPAARLEGIGIDRYAWMRANVAAGADVKGLYRAQLRSSGVLDMAGRLPRIFDRYFEPCRAELAGADASRIEMRFFGLPACMLGMYVWSNEGFLDGALGAVGARDVRFDWSPPKPDGERDRVALQSISTWITWS